uniref:PAS fold-3 domain-containing protein n=1 Tax=Timema genevievae TaxID=629358 RepID=A0A7R9JU94_TIMGE|nr:unnamed protein product [Timema genevievae]
MHPPLGSDMWRQYVFSKGQCETDSYRFLAKNGGYVWVLTQATLIYGNRGQKPNSVVCVNFVTRIVPFDQIPPLTTTSPDEERGAERG